MNANRNKLALRRHSIRRLTADELVVASGGGHTTTWTPKPLPLPAAAAPR